MKTDDSRGGTIDGHLARFGRRLNSILGEGRIPRSDKKVKAEAATQAVDDLVKAIDEEIGGIHTRHDTIQPASETGK
jgi:hypothetical protein